MNGLPQITVVGTLTGDPELKFTNSGAAVASVRIAANERRYNKTSGQFENGATTFLTGTVWRDYAEHVASSLHRGDKVIAIGVLKQRDWEKDGVKRTAVELDIEEIGPTLRYSNATVNREDSRSAAPAPSDGWVVSTEPAW